MQIQRPAAGLLLYASAIFLSSALLFLSQPMLAKAMLPWFGGAAGVWTTCMLFFQCVLLAGYLYAHLLTRYLSGRVQAAVHLALLVASILVLPLDPSAGAAPGGVAHPVWRILGVLATTVGLPYFVLSTTGPLVQAWYTGTSGDRPPYRLFALSNLASLAALLAYPLGIERFVSGKRQLVGWSAAYLVFVLLVGAAALRGGSVDRPEEKGPARRPALWIALAACGSALWLAVANHLSQEVAAIPFLWVLPLGLYLVSFILCFDRDGWYRPRLYRWILPAAWGAMGLRLALRGSGGGFQWELLLFSAALLVCCMFCHGELARMKPAPHQGLTFFYLMIAVGGALGAVLVGLVAPRAFNSYLELPVAIAACVILGLVLLYGYSSPKHLIRLGLVAALAFAAATHFRTSGGSLLKERNFYGTLQVIDSGSVRALYNGTILHGLQFLPEERSRLGTAYYGPRSGVGLVLQSRQTPNQRVGVIGLGVGTVATYGRSGDYYRFYELNPDVIRVAYSHFRFLRESKAKTEVVAGDGRLALENEPAQNFDVLVVDAFSGDSVPVHLLTKQAFETYFRHLRPGGIVAVHVTNKYLDLASVVEAAAAALGKRALFVHSPADGPSGVHEADWSLVSDGSPAARLPRKARLWTDDYSNLFQILK